VPNPCVKREDLAVLADRARRGVDSALEELVCRYQDRIAGFVYSLVGREDVISDLCHNVFVKMIINIKGLKAPDRFEPWLFQIARNSCFDYLRKERLRRIFVPFESRHEQVAAQPQKPDSRLETFRRTLRELPPKQRELILLLQENEFSYEEMASITNSSVSSVKSRLFRAREYLRRRLTDES
jgi:RNA polymerase sigma-70 factor (ECF subfamily)